MIGSKQNEWTPLLRGEGINDLTKQLPAATEKPIILI